MSYEAEYWLTMGLLLVTITQKGFAEGALEHQTLHAGLMQSNLYTRFYFGKFEKHVSSELSK